MCSFIRRVVAAEVPWGTSSAAKNPTSAISGDTDAPTDQSVTKNTTT